MKKQLIGAVLALGLGMAMAPVSAQAAKYTLIQADKDGKTITVKRGAPFEVRLSENRSTGYHWNVFEIRGKNIHLTKEQHGTALKAMPGAPGDYEAFFSTTTRGTSTIELRYERPTGIVPAKNKTMAAPAQVFTITVVVK